MPPARAAAARPPRHWRSGAAQMPPPPRRLPALPGGVHAVTAKRARWADSSQDMRSAWPPLRTHSDVLYAVHRAVHGAVGDLMDPCLRYAISSLQGHWHGVAKRKACNRRGSPLHSTCAGLQGMHVRGSIESKREAALGLLPGRRACVSVSMPASCAMSGPSTLAHAGRPCSRTSTGKLRAALPTQPSSNTWFVWVVNVDPNTAAQARKSVSRCKQAGRVRHAYLLMTALC